MQEDTKNLIHTKRVMEKEQDKKTTGKDKPTMTTKILATNI